MRRAAAFLGIEVAESDWPALVEAARFRSMREEAIRQEALNAESTWRCTWKEGAASFFFKGTNGRWREVLSEAGLTLYEHVAARLDPGLRSWLEGGSLGAGDPQPATQGPRRSGSPGGFTSLLRW